MKVELQCGDTITIPEGCKAIVKDGSVVFEKEEQKEQEFKDGDVLTSLFDNKVIFIFKEDELRQKDIVTAIMYVILPTILLMWLQRMARFSVGLKMKYVLPQKKKSNFQKKLQGV